MRLEPSYMGLVPCKRGSREPPSIFRHVGIHQEVCDPEEGPHPAVLAPWSDLQPQTVSNNVCCL